MVAMDTYKNEWLIKRVSRNRSSFLYVFVKSILYNRNLCYNDNNKNKYMEVLLWKY
jgi:hypothetical protein